MHPGQVIQFTPFKLVQVVVHCTKYDSESIINIDRLMPECVEYDGLQIVLYAESVTDLVRNATFYDQVSNRNEAVGELLCLV